METNNVSVLLTGGAGFIGCAVARRLIAARHGEVTVVDLLHPQVHAGQRVPPLLPAEVRFIPFDVTVRSAWVSLLRAIAPDCIVHLAAETGTAQSLSEASRHASTNVVGIARLLDALLEADAIPRHLVVISSRAVYGEGVWQSGSDRFSPGPRRHEDLLRAQWNPKFREGGPEAVPLPMRADSTPANPTSIYGATKLAQEHMARAWAAATDCPLSILRLQNVYGPGQSLTNPYTGIVPLFAAAARRGEAIEVYEDGLINRDFVYIDDAAWAIARCVTEPASGCRVLDIGAGKATTLLELANRIADSFAAPPPRVTGAFRDGDVRSAWADIGVTAAELGFSPRWDLADGLSAFLEWMESCARLSGDLDD